MIKSYERGHVILYLNNEWVYADNKKPITGKRQCVRCGRKPTQERYDACLGYLPKVSSACCGHGVEDPYKIKNIKKGTIYDKK